MARGQQQGDRLRDAALMRYDTRLGSIEAFQPRLDRRLTELSGNMRGLSDEMQCQIRRTDQTDSRLLEWRQQIEEETRSKFVGLEQSCQQIGSTVRVTKSNGDDVLKKYNQRLLRLESLMEEHVVSTADTSQSLVQLHSRLADIEDSSCRHARELARCSPAQTSAGGFSTALDAATVATDRASLASLGAQVAELIRKMDQLQSESHDFLSRVESTEQRCRSLRTLADTKDEQYKSIGPLGARGLGWSIQGDVEPPAGLRAESGKAQ